jgi:hypothetical protein
VALVLLDRAMTAAHQIQLSLLMAVVAEVAQVLLG